ncbi:hypothetical protein [Streptomyces sp. RTd22]|uniref:hypothetical protein n=1 Tax=Streptomyces sp. RTd22 TaxID=1841249 RepID=UPI0007C460D4|nr:hypothetical protein [Streptomyces sp. RTd22]
MSRADWKRGRFSATEESERIDRGLRAWQRHAGDVIAYWRYSHTRSVSHDIYDEGDEGGLAYDGPWAVPVLHATHTEMGDQEGDRGFYTVDTLEVSAAFAQIQKIGITQADIHNDWYLRDRIAYDGRLFRITQMSILGQIRRQDVLVSITAVEVKPDELTADAVFAQYIPAAGAGER